MDENVQSPPPITPELRIVKGENKGQAFNLTEKTTLGRERDNDIILIDPKISRYHAQITLENEVWQLTDLGSSNHTYINGEIVENPINLKPGDRISLGEIDLLFGPPGQAEAPVSQPQTTTPVGEASSVAPGPVQPAAAPVPVQSNGPSRLVLIAGAFVVLLCIAAAVALFMVSRFSDDTDNGPVTEATSGTNEEANDSTDSSNESDVEPGELSLVYEDDFSNSFGGWDDAFDAYTTKQYGNNRYQIEVSTSNLIAWGLANRDVSDFEVEVEAKQEAGGETNSYGLLFRLQDRNNFYRFDISGDGFFLLSKFVDGQWTNMVDWTASPHISSETNLIGVSVFGSEITAKVNGQELITITDDSLTHGNFGFFASTFTDEYMWVSFDNLKLWAPEGQEIVLIPTATRPVVQPTPPASPEAATPQASLTEQTAEPEAVAEVIAEETEEPEATVTTTLTPEPAAEKLASGTPAATETVEPTATPVPLPAYASRDQPLPRGESRVSGRLIFPVYDSERGTYDIYIANAADGTDLELVQAEASQPTFNEDGASVAYRSWQSDNRGVFARPLNGGDVWKVDPFFESARPDFSDVDGSLIYHSRASGREPAVYQVVNGVGEVMRREGFPIQGESAKWSPDGQRFVYSSCLGGKCGIIRSNVDGTNPIILSDHPTDTNPEISPDGNTVVFMSNRGGNWEIYRVGIDGQDLTNLSNDPASDGLPTWSPEGNKIAFVSNRDGNWSMWDMDSNGGNQRRLFVLNGPVDGVVQSDIANSRGWVEENIDWAP